MGTISIEFAPFAPPTSGDLVVFVGEDLAVHGAAAGSAGPGLEALLRRAAPAERFGGKWKTALVLPVPADLAGIDRLVAVGIGADPSKREWLALGGFLQSKLAGRIATVAADALDATAVADLALGARLRAYAFDRYKTKKSEDAEPDLPDTRLVLAVSDPEAARAADGAGAGLAEGVNLARDLVNEPPNVLFPAEFARRAEALRALGVAVEVLDEEELGRIGMRALLAVGQGSRHGSRVALMHWKGGGDEAPVAIVGKGVCFDSGGISIKPAAGMEDMKGDMAGAACVVGLMHALASRGARANVIAAIGLTENMPDGNAQRPGDIVTTLSGQTVEMVNSDAEGRLVLGDVLWYVGDRYKPACTIDLATLTGAIVVALGHDNAGLFSNDDDLAARLVACGVATGEKVWRMPLGKAYDKLIDSKFADMKNTGGRAGGAVTAAQFLQRFVRDTPWAHLDIAGTGFSVPNTDINHSWGPGWGVRLLDRYVREHHETA